MGSGLRAVANRCLIRENAGGTMTVLHHALCGDSFEETPVSIVFTVGKLFLFFFLFFFRRCNSGELLTLFRQLDTTRDETYTGMPLLALLGLAQMCGRFSALVLSATARVPNGNDTLSEDSR